MSKIPTTPETIALVESLKEHETLLWYDFPYIEVLKAPDGEFYCREFLGHVESDKVNEKGFREYVGEVSTIFKLRPEGLNLYVAFYGGGQDDLFSHIGVKPSECLYPWDQSQLDALHAALTDFNRYEIDEIIAPLVVPGEVYLHEVRFQKGSRVTVRVDRYETLKALEDATQRTT